MYSRVTEWLAGDEGPVTDIEMWRLHGEDDTSLANKNTADALGDALFACQVRNALLPSKGNGPLLLSGCILHFVHFLLMLSTGGVWLPHSRPYSPLDIPCARELHMGHVRGMQWRGVPRLHCTATVRAISSPCSNALQGLVGRSATEYLKWEGGQCGDNSDVGTSHRSRALLLALPVLTSIDRNVVLYAGRDGMS